MAISRYHLQYCIALPEMVPGDSHGPKGPRNDMEVVNVGRGLAPAANSVTHYQGKVHACSCDAEEYNILKLLTATAGASPRPTAT